MMVRSDWLIVNGETGTRDRPKPTCIEAAKKYEDMIVRFEKQS